MGKYYSVLTGVHPGIHGTWDEAKKQVDGFSKADYKSFKSYDEAKSWLKGKGAKSIKSFVQVDTPVEEEPDAVFDVSGDENPVQLFTDGSYDQSSEVYSWAYALVYHNRLLLTHSGKKHAGEDNMWQVSGEIEGVLQGLNACQVLKISHVTVDYDLINLQKWADHEWKARKPETKNYQNKVDEYRKMGLAIDFQKVKAHTGTKYNELADYLAKKELGIKKHDNLDSIRGMLGEDN